MKKLLFPLALALLLLSGCGNAAAESTATTASREIFAMDTYLTVTCYGNDCEAALEAAAAEIARIEAVFSVGAAESEISLLNAAGSAVLSDETLSLVTRALSLWETTGGAFDITVYPLMELWGFTGEVQAVPEEETLQTLLALCGSDKLTLEGNVLTLGEGQGIDLGGIAKGYTATQLCRLFADYDLTGAVVSLGGDVQCYGTKEDGSLWRVGIRDPFHSDDSSALLGIVSVSTQAVVTSGGYERYFEEDGATYHHILNPATGYPSDSGLVSVTVISDDGALADGLSTACYILGLEGSADYWRSYGEDFELILMTGDGALYVTQGIAEFFTSDYAFTVLTR